jgi:hypothetical protein
MTSIPIELAIARRLRSEAWDMYTQVIDREHTYQEFLDSFNSAQAADITATDWYNRWQKVGGTSDIERIVAAENLQRTALLRPRTVLDDMTDYLDLKATEANARY